MTGGMPPKRRLAGVDRAAHRWAMRMIDDPDRHRPALQAWLARNPAHAETYRALMGNLDAAARIAASPDFRRAPVVAAPRRRRRVMIALPVAAGLVGLLGFGAILHSPRALLSGEETGRNSVTIVTATADQARMVRIGDGSILTLAAGSSVSVHLDPHRRSIDLRRGRVRFKVAHEHSRPFVVLAGGGTITATGTIFEVDLGARVEVQLLEGSVEVVSPMADTSHGRPRRTAHLVAGEKLSFAIARPAAVSKPANTLPGQTIRSFDNVPLGAVIAELNRGAAPQIMLSDSSLAQRHVFLDIETDDRAAIATKLAVLFDLERVDAPSQVILLKPRARAAPSP